MKNSHAIVTYSGTHYLITPEQEEKLRDVKSHSQFKIDGSMVMGSNIAEVMTIQKYYETYPDKRPGRLDVFKGVEGMGMSGIIKNSRAFALKGMIKGLTGYINSDRYKGTDAPKELLKEMESRLRVCVG